MAQKISTLILEVDLSCCKCHRKIKKILCELKDQENIKEINYDVKNNKVTISGPFDPHTLTRTLYCKACKIIIKISTPPPPPDPKPKPKPTKLELPPGPDCCAKPTYEWLYGVLKCSSCGMLYAWTNQCQPPTDKKCHPTPDKKLCLPEPGCCMGMKCSSSCCTCGSGTNYQCLPPPAANKTDDKPNKPDHDDHHEKKKKNNTTPAVDPCKPVCQPEPVCCPRPCYVGMYGGTICASCGMKCPWTNHQVSAPHVYGYGYGEPKPCYFICEDSTPLCTIM
ncbi:Copper chaperone domain-containing protein [Dioscorea alata]|uniref:Copper chaperone domain-containing protein n=1 Tax=Dioscorea alata TaxID=55571 RepID=A0ACB7UJC9_DIOAL|nr:Copper chaperone domain-containing protein [Dioscorea alata]